jgi:predicted dehydrogenase/threonine dehydrogenase-like Zn-dependent dehydrogenase
MKQVFQNFRTGLTELDDVPTPLCQSGHLLVRSRYSLISTGTERMLVEFSQASLLAKAKAQPDKIRQVLDKIRADGLLPTLEAVFARLDQPFALGYCNAGVVVQVGEGVTGYSVGDRVVSNGPHAEFICVPENLCARIPEGVSDAEAAFTTLASVSLQGVRLVQPTLGEKIAVIGLGLVGLITVQILVANGCQVLGIDFDKSKLGMARQFGAHTVDLSKDVDPVNAGMVFSAGYGMDGVLITASSKSDDPIHHAAQMSRQRGRIVLVGVVGLSFKRSDFYAKELSFQVACSYGPGRYDEGYEKQGQDYPFGFVRWTAQRNFQAVLNLIVCRKIDFSPLISREIPQTKAAEAYQWLTENREALGILLSYPVDNEKPSRTVLVTEGESSHRSEEAIVGLIGAGNFASLVLAPALQKTNAVLKTVASASGASATHVARKFGFKQATSDYRVILEDPEINTVFVLTRHNTHARLVVEALKAGKHVFVEKPLALNREELAEIREVFGATEGKRLMVGFNRRFAPHSIEIKRLLAERSQPLTAIFTVNAGSLPNDHWLQNPEIGGGRIIGEGCHFIDLLRFLVDSPLSGLKVIKMGGEDGKVGGKDQMMINLEFVDGSIGGVNYLANGHKGFPKERLEIFSEGRIFILDNFKDLNGFGWKGFKKKRLWRQDKGHRAEVALFIERIVDGGDPLIPWCELEEVAIASFTAVEQAEKPSKIGLDYLMHGSIPQE